MIHLVSKHPHPHSSYYAPCIQHVESGFYVRMVQSPGRRPTPRRSAGGVASQKLEAGTPRVRSRFIVLGSPTIRLPFFGGLEFEPLIQPTNQREADADMFNNFGKALGLFVRSMACCPTSLGAG